MNETIKNIGILAHVDAGKTTLTEQLLFHTGAIRNLGRVDHGSTQTDGLELERERGISIVSMPTSYNYKGHKINIVDTPGHVDFVAEVERSMLVLDGAILVLSAREGVQSHTKLLFNALQRMEVPTLIFINKIDRLGVELNKVLAQIRSQLTPALCVMQTVDGEGSRESTVSGAPVPLDDSLVEALGQIDETVLVDYLEGHEIESDRLHNALRRAVAACAVCPVFFGSALHSVGVAEMLDAVNDLLPAFIPLDTAETSGIVFKVYRRYVRHLRQCMIKLTAGEVRHRGFIGDAKVTVPVQRWNHGKLEPVGTLYPGDIGVLTGFSHLHVGDTFGQGIGRQTGFSLGKPTLKVKVAASRPSQREALLEALTVMSDNDPYLSYELSEFNDDIYISLFGYVQMEIIESWLQRDYGVEIEMADPMTIFMETPITTAEAQVSMHEDGLPFAAAVGFRVEPLPRGRGIEYVSEVNTGSLRQTFQNGVEDGVFAYLDQGLHGWELTDLKITLISFAFDSVSSTPKDYRNLSPLVLFEALKRAGTKLLWPISEYRLELPTTLMGRAMADLQRMKATIDDPLFEADTCVIQGTVPVDLCANYEYAIHQYTSGMGHFETKVIGYEDAPKSAYRERPRFRLEPSNRGAYLLAMKQGH